MSAFLIVSGMSAQGITVATPTFAPVEGSSATDLPVSVVGATPGSTIHYTLNGIEPTVYDPVIASGNIITFKRSLTLKARAWVGADVSATASAEFEVTGEIEAGTQHALALKSNKLAYGWGYQTYGKLANGVNGASFASPDSLSYSSGTPVTNAIAIAAGYNQNVVLDGSTGSPWCVGYGGVGELGNNTNLSSNYPVRVLKSTTTNDWLTACIAVEAGQYYSGALGSDGKVYTWGSNSGNGRLGNGVATGTRYYAGRVLKASGIDLASIKAIEFGYGQALALDTNGKVWAWGNNSNGQIGNGSTTGSQLYAGTVLASGTRTSSPVDLTDVTDISTGDLHSALVRWNGAEQGTVWTFGSRASGRLGDGSTTGNSGLPVRVRINSTPTYLTHIVQVSAGAAHTLALDDTGHVWAWGYNLRGALGNDSATNADSAYAVQVLSPTGSGATYLSDIVRISAGGIGSYTYSLAVDKNGTIYAWGGNDGAQLGTGTNSIAATKRPVAIGSLKVIPNSPDITLAQTVIQSGSPGAVNLTAFPTDLDGTGNIQKVEFYSNGTLVETKTTSPWNKSLTGLPVGNYYNYAVVTDNDGNAGYSQPTSFTVVPSPPAVSLSANVVQLYSPASAILKSNPTDPDGNISKVEFFVQGTLVGQATSAPWQFSLGGLAAGTYQAYAKVTDTTGFSAFSNTLSFTTINMPAPGSPDLDGDGLADEWELACFSNLNQSQEGDPDHDGLTNLQEAATGTDPNSIGADTDLNGIPDDWESANAGKFAAYPLILSASIGRNQSTTSPLHLRNQTSSSVSYSMAISGGKIDKYWARDSLTGGLAYAWEEISSTGTLLSTVSSSDGGVEEVPISGFNFPFYGTNYNKVYVSANGLLTFGVGSSAYDNESLPAMYANFPLIAAFWDDLNTNTSGEVYWKQETDRLIIQYQNVARVGGSGTCTFQAVLFSDGRVQLRYKSMTGAVNSCTVGVQNSDQSQRLLTVFNAPYIVNSMAIEMSPAIEFFKVTALSGVVPANSTATVNTTFQSVNYPEGLYNASLSISHNGNGTTPLQIEASLKVNSESVQLILPVNRSIVQQGNPIDFYASAFDSDGVVKVEFYDGVAKIGEAVADPYLFASHLPSVGEHSFTAKMIDPGNAAITSSPLSLTVIALDSDGDGAPDSSDAFPFDPTRSTAPAAVGGDVTPPQIFLSAPSNALSL